MRAGPALLSVVAGGVRGEVTSLAVPVPDEDGGVGAALALIAPSVHLEDLDLAMIVGDLGRVADLLPRDRPPVSG